LNYEVAGNSPNQNQNNRDGKETDFEPESERENRVDDGSGNKPGQKSERRRTENSDCGKQDQKHMKGYVHDPFAEPQKTIFKSLPEFLTETFENVHDNPPYLFFKRRIFFILVFYIISR
jgi:hypothetical protein